MHSEPRPSSLAERLATVTQAIERATENRRVTLVGASKGQPTPLLEEAIGLGITEFGENRVQEAKEKWPALKARHPGVRLHLIGPLQSNKAAEAVALFDVIQTVDRPKIAESIAREMARFSGGESVGLPTRPSASTAALKAIPTPQRAHGGSTGGLRTDNHERPFIPPRLLIQVNIGEEPQKSGVAPKDTKALLTYCHGLGLSIDGLMCVPPEGVNPAPYFALLHKMARELGLRELSMGMSGDYETALRLGATMVRVGTALFGKR